MATPSIRGHQATIKFFQDGNELPLVATATRCEVNQDSSFSRSFYVGQKVGEGDQVQEGWSGSADFEVKDDSLDSMIDALITDNLNGVGVSDYTFITTENYANGQTASYVYSDAQFKLSKSQPAMTDKVTKRLEFQASLRTRL